MSGSSENNLTSPSDRFLPTNFNTSAHLARLSGTYSPGPTSDLSQAVGNFQNALSSPTEGNIPWKWTEEEEDKILSLRQTGMMWEEIAKQLGGQSALSFQNHYCTNLIQRVPWTKEGKSKLAESYEK